jgi:signal transduction histidine kinase
LEATYNRLQFAQEELITKERLTLVGKLAASLMHDIRNPMTAISGYAQLIKEENCPKEKVSQYADRIVMEVNFFMEMAQELLLFARGEGILRKEEVDFNTFLQDFINIIGPKFKEQGFTVKCKNDFNDKVSIDTSRFRRALENICNNAMEAMSEGGAFLIEGLCVKNGLRIALTDNGCGMTDFVKDHIFDEFFSHGKKQGTGLGLSITKRIIEEHGGSIRVESQLGLGTRFIIDLP